MVPSYLAGCNSQTFSLRDVKMFPYSLLAEKPCEFNCSPIVGYLLLWVESRPLKIPVEVPIPRTSEGDCIWRLDL